MTTRKLRLTMSPSKHKLDILSRELLRGDEEERVVVKRMFGSARGLLPIFGIAVGVALLGTATGFAWDRQHKVVADQIEAERGIAAARGADGVSQTLKFANWGLTATLPLAPELPLVNSIVEAGDTVGLSSADLMGLGVQCQAGRNALGSITRYPSGAYGTTVKPRAGANVVSTIDAYDYVYQLPQTACADKPESSVIINREAAIVLEGLGTLAPER